MPGEVAELANGGGRDKAGADQPMREQVGEPLAVFPSSYDPGTASM